MESLESLIFASGIQELNLFGNPFHFTNISQIPFLFLLDSIFLDFYM